MNKSAILVAVLVATLLFSSFAVLALELQKLYPSSGWQVDTAPSQEISSIHLAFTCPAKTGSCSPVGLKACDEDLGVPPVLHACEYECQAGGTWGSGSECGTNMCYGGECQSASVIFNYFAW